MRFLSFNLNANGHSLLVILLIFIFSIFMVIWKNMVNKMLIVASLF